MGPRHRRLLLVLLGLSLLGATTENLLAAFVFGGGRACITHTCVGGTWHRWEDG